LLAIAAALALTSCGDSSPPRVQSEALRAGVDRSVRAGSLAWAPGTGQYEGTSAATDENRGEKVGAMVPAQGGQKARLEAKEKERTALAAAQARERAEESRQAAKPAKPSAGSPIQQ
jgi:hypothetical protein